MNPPEPAVRNLAEDNAFVGLQAHTVHTLHQTYNLAAGATPAQEYEVGVRYLDNGMPKKALEIIEHAIARGYRTSAVCFHQLLALLSGRTLQMLSQRDFSRLEAARTGSGFPADDWTEGIRFVERLLRNIATEDEAVGIEDIDKLAPVQRRKILRHLEMFLKGPVEDHAWRQIVHEAGQGQVAGDREHRAWKFFQPDPVGPREVSPPPVTIGTAIRLTQVTATAVFVAVIGYLGLLVLRGGQFTPVVAYLTSLAGGTLWAWNGTEWRFRTVRLRAKEQEYRTPPRERRTPPAGGFAEDVDRLFRTYFGRYVPADTDRKTWLKQTRGIRRTIRDEIVTSYRDSEVDADAIAWLIRHRVAAVKQRWQRNTLWDFRDRYRTPALRKLGAVAGAVLVVIAGICALTGAVPVEPLYGSLAVPVLLIAGWAGMTAWLRIVVEHRRYADQLAENRETYHASRRAYEGWRRKLADMPDDPEMAAWLECDRIILMDTALRHYKLLRSNLIAHTFIEAPADDCRSAREVNAPWRFSRYRLLVFLLTTDGVRQFSAELDFLNVVFEKRERTNYRYDAVASVLVAEGSRHERTFELTLMSGYQFEVPVTGTGEEKLIGTEQPGSVSELTVDAAGLRNTLHILEGIAAEGKDWITHEDQRSGERIRRLRRAVHDLID